MLASDRVTGKETKVGKLRPHKIKGEAEREGACSRKIIKKERKICDSGFVKKRGPRKDYRRPADLRDTSRNEEEDEGRSMFIAETSTSVKVNHGEPIEYKEKFSHEDTKKMFRPTKQEIMEALDRTKRSDSRRGDGGRFPKHDC